VGFATIGSFIMMFFALVFLVSMFILIQQRMIETTSESASVQQQRFNEQVLTNIEIINISFDNLTDPDTTTMYVENSGSNKLSIEFIDLFIDGTIIPRDTANRTIAFDIGSTAINPLHWDPDEVIIIEIYLDLVNITHLATISTEYAVKDTQQFLG